jgi:hypothetical protein
MLKGRCPRCQAQAVFKMRNGIISGDKHVFVRGLGLLTPRSDRMTNLCTECGYYDTSLEAIMATCRPWNRAASSSFSLGIRWPDPPAMVVAP